MQRQGPGRGGGGVPPAGAQPGICSLPPRRGTQPSGEVWTGSRRASGTGWEWAGEARGRFPGSGAGPALTAQLHRQDGEPRRLVNKDRSPHPTAHIHVHLHTYMNTCAHTCTGTRAGAHTHTHICTCVHTHAHAHTHCPAARKAAPRPHAYRTAVGTLSLPSQEQCPAQRGGSTGRGLRGCDRRALSAQLLAHSERALPAGLPGVVPIEGLFFFFSG